MFEFCSFVLSSLFSPDLHWWYCGTQEDEPHAHLLTGRVSHCASVTLVLNPAG